MYIPKSFAVEDLSALHAFMQRYSFATLFTATPEPMVTHLPLLLDIDRGSYGTLVGHFARPNPHWLQDHEQYMSVCLSWATCLHLADVVSQRRAGRSDMELRGRARARKNESAR